MSSYKFIDIKRNGEEEFNGHPVHRIYTKSGDQIGIISFYRPWRKYVFSSNEECVFDLKCLKSVIEFMESEL